MLASQVPALRTLALAASADQAEDARAVDEDVLTGDLIRQLKQLLGPDAHGSPLVRSHTALDWGRRYVLELAGLLVDDDDPDPAGT